MKKLTGLLASLYLLALPSLLWAGGEGLELPEAMEKKIPVEGLGSFNLFFAQAYNDNLWVYAAYCTILMCVVGMVIALGTDVILKSIGLDVHKIEHKE